MRLVALTTFALLAACKREQGIAADPQTIAPAPSQDGAPEPEELLARILRTYPERQFSSDPKLPPPNDPWKGKRLRLGGRVRAVETQAIHVAAVGVESWTFVRCVLAKPGPVGARVVIEGTLVYDTRARTLPPGRLPHNPLENEDAWWWFEPRLDGCKLVESTPRTFGITAAKLGLTVVPLKELRDAPLAPGKRVAFTAEVSAFEPGRLRLNDWDTSVHCRGSDAEFKQLSQYERVAFAATVAPAADASARVFDDCRPLDP